MKIDLTPVFQAFIAVLAALITYKLIPWIKSKTTENQQENLAILCKTLVYGAEQIFGSKQGKEKLQYVLDALEEAGYDVDSEKIRAAIEAAVREMNIYGNDLETVKGNAYTLPVKDGIALEDLPFESLVSFCVDNGFGLPDEMPAGNKEARRVALLYWLDNKFANGSGIVEDIRKADDVPEETPGVNDHPPENGAE